jgi:hypothetical protein
MGDLGQAFLGALGQAIGVHLQHEVRRDGDQVGVAGALAVAVHDALHLEDPVLDRDQRVGDRASGVVVDMDPYRGRHLGDDAGDDARDVRRQHPAVRVTQDQTLGARLLRRSQHVHRVRRVAHVPVEEVLRVEEHAAVLRA